VSAHLQCISSACDVHLGISVLLVGPAALWFPALRSPILIEIHAIAHALRVPGQEFVIPDLGSSLKFLEALGVTEPAGHVILRNQAYTGFEFFHSGIVARQQEGQEADRKEESHCSCHWGETTVRSTSLRLDPTAYTPTT
jgi:hypothetical protein